MRTVVVSGRPSLSSSARSRRLTSGMERSASPMARPHSGSAGHAIDSRSMLSSSNSSFAPALPAGVLGLGLGLGFAPIHVRVRVCAYET